MPAPTTAPTGPGASRPAAAPPPPLARSLALAVPFAHLVKLRAPPSPALATSSKGAVPAAAPRTPAEPRHRGEPARRDPAPEREDDPLDPTTRRLAQLAPPHAHLDVPAPVAARVAEPAGEIAPRARVSLEELLPQLVRRIAWAGDRRRGSVQLELGAGRHAGAIVTVHSDNGRVRVDVQGSDELRARIDERLARHGLEVESVR